MKTEDIQIRDPYVLPVAAEGVYYLFGTTDKQPWGGKAEGFDAWRSRDLHHWEGPFPAFRPEPGFWADENFWAPEVHCHSGRYFMFASFKAAGKCRATQVLVADRPQGPYRTHGPAPLTPPDWECLDGTLFIDDAGAPWMVFCHEWLQMYDGSMDALPLRPDLSGPAGDPVTLFRASEATWAKSFFHDFPKGAGTVQRQCRVTDGPFLHRTRSGQLLMLWSSQGSQGYAMGLARSVSGRIQGPWTQEPEALYATDGGHGMLFRRFDGGLCLSLHAPNNTPLERACFLPVVEMDSGLRLG